MFFFFHLNYLTYVTILNIEDVTHDLCTRERLIHIISKIGLTTKQHSLQLDVLTQNLCSAVRETWAGFRTQSLTNQ